MKRIVSFIVVFTLVMGGMTHAQAQSKAAEKAEKNLERKDILNVKKHTKNKSVFNNSQLVLNILYDTSIKYKNNKSYPR